MDGKNETIVDRVVERLKQAPLGDLITEEDLHDIVKQAIPKVFFEKRFSIENPGSYHEKRIEQPPLLNETLEAVLKPAVQEAVKVWIVENAQMLTDHWKSIFDVGIRTYVLQQQEGAATEAARTITRGLVEVLNRERQQAGLPQISFY